MKNYLNFNLDPKKILLFWVLFLILVITPYFYLIINRYFNPIIERGTQFSFFFVGIGMIIVAISLYYFFLKLAINGIGYKEENLEFDGTFGEYMGKNLLGLFLSMITLGIYSPWYMKDITRYYADNTSYRSNSFCFLGRVRDLLLIIFLTVIVPIIALSCIFILTKVKVPLSTSNQLIFQLLYMPISLISTYFIYRWFVNFNYKNYHLSWNTKILNSLGKILLEFFLSIVTLGIYFPLAYLKLYKYFVERTVAISPEKKLRFGFDIMPSEDFLFLWGQILLCIFTLTIYTPWAWSKVGARVIGRTYIEKEEEY